MTYRVAVAVSGRGSNLDALCEAVAGRPEVEIVQVIADRPAVALDRAAARGIATHRLDDFRDGAEWQRILATSDADLLVLAGYLRLVPATVVHALSGRIINVHPALLPKYGGPGMHGRRVHEAVLAAGELESGATVHLVDEEYDRGTILGRAVVPVPKDATAESLAAAVLAVEHRLLPAAVLAAAVAGRPVPFDFAR